MKFTLYHNAVLVVLLLSLTSPVLGFSPEPAEQKTVELPDLKKPHQLTVAGNEVYIFDEDNYELLGYSLDPFGLKFKLGKKGDGLDDFKYLPFVFIQADSFCCTDFTKTIWYSKSGTLLKVKQYSDFEDFDLNSEMLLIPTGKNYLRITADHDRQKRLVFLLDSQFKTFKKLYEGPFIWRRNEPIGYRIHTVVYGDKIFISDNQKGFYIEVFNHNGDHLFTINKNRDMVRIPLKKDNKSGLFHPLLHHFEISADKIYATTYKKSGDLSEMIVMNLKGKVLKRLFIPLPSKKADRRPLRFDLFYVDQHKLFELIMNKKTEKWELHITELPEVK